MKKVLIGIVIAIVLIVVVYFLLPEGARNYVDYYKMQVTDKETYQEIQSVRNSEVLNQDSGTEDPYTYGDILSANIDYEYWTYEKVLNSNATYSTTVTAYGSNLTLTYGEGGDSGVCQDSDIVFVFELDNKGGYNLTVYIDGSQLSTDDRNLLLAKMCQLTD